MPSLCTSIAVRDDVFCLRETLFYHLSQWRRSDEIVITDDGSTDATPIFLENFQKLFGGHPNVSIRRNPTSAGVLEIGNKRLVETTADYVWFIGCDDFPVRLDFISKALEMAQGFPNAGLITADPLFLVGDQIGVGGVEIGEENGYLSPQDLIARQKQGPIQLPGHTSLFRREAALEFGGLLPELGHHADWFLAWCVAYRYGAGYLKGGWVAYRVRERSNSQLARQDTEYQKRIREAMYIFLDKPEMGDVRKAFAASGAIEEHVQ